MNDKFCGDDNGFETSITITIVLVKDMIRSVVVNVKSWKVASGTVDKGQESNNNRISEITLLTVVMDPRFVRNFHHTNVSA